jgi:hypothetical protein
MRIEDVVESFNQYIDDIRKEKDINIHSFLVVRKHIESTEQFKAYKIAIVEIFVVDKVAKYRLFHHQYTGRIVSQIEEEVLLDLDRLATKTLFSIDNTEVFDKIVNGEYNENIVGN